MCVEVHCRISLILGFYLWLLSRICYLSVCVLKLYCGGCIGSSCALGAGYVAEIWFGGLHFKMISLECFVFLALRCVSFGCASVWLWFKSYFRFAFGWCHFIFTAAGKRRGRESSLMFSKYLMCVKCLASLFKLNSGSSCNDFLF